MQATGAHGSRGMSSQRLRVPSGEPFEVALDEPAATGHRWQLADAGEGIALLDDRYEPPNRKLGLGASGRRVINLRVTGTGHYVLRFLLARPWEDRPSAEHLVDVDVVEPQ
jgi:predicted secreted protein